MLLSRPTTDFTGGQLYLIDPAAAADGAAEDVATRTVEWAGIGDLVVFAANAKEVAAQQGSKNWLHGFREVRAGSTGAGGCHLCVAGLLE